ncbi:hypothetical protein [Pelomonas cellulosilytica]|uniref:Uncharacterized protein n=1 Tax=Pelomonas cellulosilytica TaxID=2906762 RepID=A0ABS8Y2Q2_9BURK|nr:hypothetical protein [Pelomonas sp. P8]MCE4557256.1 hypothetical protein [Pelomonas sp. P8]
MSEPTTLTELAQPGANNRPLFAALTRWWGPAASPTAEPVLGYESAQPWILDDASAEAGPHSPS